MAGEARIGRAVLEITVDDKPYRVGLDSVKAKADETSKSVASISTMLKVEKFIEFGKFAAQAIGTVASTVVELGQRGATIDDVAGRFGELSQRAGETADTMLGELRAGFANTLTDFDSMKLATSALSVGFIKSKEDMRTLADGARLLADRTGGSTAEAFDTLTKAMTTGRTAGLKQLGLYVDSDRAIAAYAASVNKSTAQLTDHEKAQAMGVATLAKLRGELQASGPVALDFGDRIDQIKTAFTNFTDGLALGIARSPVLAQGMDAAGKALATAFGPEQASLINVLVKGIETFAIGAVSGASIIVEAARFISVGFEGVKGMFVELLETIFSGVARAASVLQEMASVSTILPVVGEKFVAMATKMQAVEDAANTVSQGFGEMKYQSLASAGSISAGFDKVQTVLGATKDAMVAARDSAAGAAAGTSQAMGTMGAATDTITARAAENTKKIKDLYTKLSEEIVLGTKEGIDKRLTELEFSRQREIESIRQLKELSSAEYDALVVMVNEKYAQLVNTAKLGADAIRDRTVTLQQELQLAESTGLQARLLQLQFAQAQELQSIAILKDNYSTEYAALAAMISQKYAAMTAAAQGHFTNVALAAAAGGFKTRAELEQTALVAEQTYQQMLASGMFTDGELQRAHEAAETAKRAATDKTKQYTLDSGQALVQGSVQLLGVLGEKNKTAAIASAIISTYQAVAKALGSAPWPANLALAAGALAAGLSNVNKIRQSDPGFKVGTPGLDFARFGKMTQTVLHGEEAVIPRGKGHVLAGEIAAAMPGGDAEGGLAGKLDDLIDAVRAQPNQMKRAIRDGLLLATS